MGYEIVVRRNKLNFGGGFETPNQQESQGGGRIEAGRAAGSERIVPVGEEQADAEAAEAEEEGPSLGDGASQHELVSSSSRCCSCQSPAPALVEAHLLGSLATSSIYLFPNHS